MLFNTHKDWCNLLSIMESKDNINIDVDQIKRLTASKSAPADSDSDVDAKVPRNNKARAGFLPAPKK